MRLGKLPPLQEMEQKPLVFPLRPELPSDRRRHMKAAYLYHAFGLNILSEIEMPHWVAGTGPVEVSVVWGTVPSELSAAVRLREVCWWRADACLLNYPAIGRLLIEPGGRITAELADGGTPSAMGTLIASTGLAVVLYQRGQICLHASCVAKDGRAILITGNSGAGKSTLASALLKRGYDFISDDICVIQPGSDETYEVFRSYPSLRLCDDSFRELDFIGHPRSVDAFDDKLRVRPEVDDAAQRATVVRICLLETGPVSEPIAESIRGIERVRLVQQNMFRPRLANLIGDKERLLAMSVGLGRSLDAIRIVRPPSGFHLDSLCALATK